MNLPTTLYYYRCRICAGIIITGHKAKGYEPCNGCQSFAKLLFEQPVETPEQQDCAELVAKQGRVYRFSPSLEPFAYTPARIEPGHSTVEERNATSRQDDERMEAAHHAAEGRQR